MSVYESAEAVACCDSKHADVMQLPFSIFDRKMKKSGVFERALRNNTEVFSRSAFTQGLVLINCENIPTHLEKAKPYMERFSDICSEYGVSRAAAALQYVKRESGISCLVVGVDSIDQLKKNINNFSDTVGDQFLTEIEIAFNGVKENNNV
ncbi:MAG: aldo/keto reductase [Oscillospiraceae bacterium]